MGVQDGPGAELLGREGRDHEVRDLLVRHRSADEVHVELWVSRRGGSGDHNALAEQVHSLIHPCELRTRRDSDNNNGSYIMTTKEVMNRVDSKCVNSCTNRLQR